eukprot:SAG31_NODE_16212_length_718_cov_1.127625_1_plen_72_part_10
MWVPVLNLLSSSSLGLNLLNLLSYRSQYRQGVLDRGGGNSRGSYAKFEAQPGSGGDVTAAACPAALYVQFSI